MMKLISIGLRTWTRKNCGLVSSRIRVPLSYCVLTTLHRNCQQKIHVRKKSSLFACDRENVANNFQFDHGLEGKLADMKSLELNLASRGINIDLNTLVSEKCSYTD